MVEKKKHKRSSAATHNTFASGLTVADNETAMGAEPTSGGGTAMTSPRGNAASWPTSPLSPKGRPTESFAGRGLTTTQQATVGATTGSGGLLADDAAAVASNASPLDEILIFGHGKFQRLILLCTQLAVFCTVIHVVTRVNLARPVEHWCGPPPAYANLPPEMWKNASIPLEEDGSYSKCVRYEPPFVAGGEENASAYLRHHRGTVPCDAGWNYAASTRNSIVAEWDLVCHRRWILSLLATSYAAGAVVVTPFSGVAADRLGRRPVLGASLFVLLVAGIVLAFARTLLVFAALSFVVSASAGSLLVISVVLLFEVTDSSRRVLYCCVALAGGLSAAKVYGQLFYELVQDWSLFQLINMIPTALLIGAMYFVEESPCWLLATRRFGRVCKVVLSAAEMNGVDVVRVARRLDEIRKSKKSRTSTTCLSASDEASPVALLTNPDLRAGTMVAFGCWFLTIAAFYTLRLSHEDHAAYYALMALELPAAIANVLLMRRKGRRLSVAVSMIALGFLVAALGTISFLLPGKCREVVLSGYSHGALLIAIKPDPDLTSRSVAIGSLAQGARGSQSRSRISHPGLA
ncbi:solute carrier family 22 member 7-like [Dermacentor variabilis]|uniref:solute carrier family 22 member 7-like n=1 Tax=Dermacentor variabilis TaxID=34621 RepID=UPI003F5C3874